jgi:hypothetical protein
MNRLLVIKIDQLNFYRWICVVLVAISVLPACLPITNAPTPVSTIYRPSALQQPAPVESESDAPAKPVVLSTSVLITAINAIRTPVEPDILFTPTADPVHFVFPTPGIPPISSWRPPLYPTPWAPTPYDHFYFARPIAADEINWPVETYRYGGIFFEDVVHTGIELHRAAPQCWQPGQVKSPAGRRLPRWL